MAASTSELYSLDTLGNDVQHTPIPITYSVILLGDLGVGKSSLFRRLDGGEFVEFNAATIGKPFCTVKPKTLDNALVEVHDTAGMERMGTMTKNYFLLADGAIIMYDLMNTFTVDNVYKWKNALTEYIPDAVIMIVGNKAEALIDDDTGVAQDNYDKATTIAQENQIHLHKIISCKTGEGITETIEDLAKALHEAKRNLTRRTSTVTLHDRRRKKTKSEVEYRYSKGEEIDKSNCSC